MNEVNLKKELLNQAEMRISDITKVASTLDVNKKPVKQMLLKEADERVTKTRNLRKRAQRREKDMDVRDSTANVKWFLPNKTSRIRQIEDELLQAFEPYFQKLGATPGMHVSNNVIAPRSESQPGEDPASLRMEFGFKRMIIPIDPDFQPIAIKSIEMIDTALQSGQIPPKFREFIDYLEKSSVGLQCYYHRTTKPLGSEDENKGGMTPEEIKRFILAESDRYTNSLPVNMSNEPLPSGGNFYAAHRQRYSLPSDDYWPKGPGQPKDDARRFKMESAFQIYWDTYLMRAIAQKIWEGYRLNPNRLYEQAEQHAKKLHKVHQLFQYSRSKQKAVKYKFYQKYFHDLATDVIEQYNRAMEKPSSGYKLLPSGRTWNLFGYEVEGEGENARYAYFSRWGDAFRGLRIQNLRLPNICPFCYDQHSRTDLSEVKKQEGVKENGVKCPKCGQMVLAMHAQQTSKATDLTTHQLQWLLYALTDKSAEPLGNITIMDGRRKKSRTIPTLTTPETFVITRFSLTRDPNGFDSDPQAPELFTTVLPPLMQLADRKLFYDTEKGNLGLSHILHSAKLDPSGRRVVSRPIENLLKEWGPWCDQAWRVLSQGNPELFEKLYEHASVLPTDPNYEPVPYEAWEVIMSEKGNRTGAETLLEMLQGKIPVAIKKKIVREPGQPLSYEEYAGLLDQMRGGKANMTRSRQANIQYLTPEGFDLLRKYGYQTAKVMDFVSALMTRSCEEKLTRELSGEDALQRRQERIAAIQGIEDRLEPDPQSMNIEDTYFHGRTYSSSTGKAEFGKVLFGVMYTFRPPTLGDPSDAQWQTKFNKYWYSRHLKKSERSPFPVVRQDRLPQDPEKAPPLPEEFQPSGASPYAAEDPSKRTWVIVEKMTFWTGLASSKSRWAKAVDQEVDYTRALSALLTRYPDISNDLGVIFEPVSIMLRNLRIAASSAINAARKALANSGLPTAVMIVDHDHDAIRYLDDAGITAARAYAQAEEQSDAARMAQQGIDQSDTGPTEIGETTEAPEAIPPTDATDAPVPGTPIGPAVPPPPMGQPEAIGPEPTAGQPNVPPLPVPPTPGDPDQERLRNTEEGRRAMPKPFPMQEPSYISKRKTTRSLIRKSPDAATSKLRPASLIDDLIKLADKLDEGGEQVVANKIDRLLSILSEE